MKKKKKEKGKKVVEFEFGLELVKKLKDKKDKKGKKVVELELEFEMEVVFELELELENDDDDVFWGFLSGNKMVYYEILSIKDFFDLDNKNGSYVEVDLCVFIESSGGFFGWLLGKNKKKFGELLDVFIKLELMLEEIERVVVEEEKCKVEEVVE